MSGLLVHTPADILRYLLVDLGIGTLPSSDGEWPVFVSSEPSLPDQVITLYDTAGRFANRSMRSGEKAEFHGVEIRIRGINHQDASRKANELAVALDEEIKVETVTIPEETAGTGSSGEDSIYVVYSVSRVSGPFSLGNEPETNRILFTINAVVALRQTT